jgi:hypothetical protein
LVAALLVGDDVGLTDTQRHRRLGTISPRDASLSTMPHGRHTDIVTDADLGAAFSAGAAHPPIVAGTFSPCHARPLTTLFAGGAEGRILPTIPNSTVLRA